MATITVRTATQAAIWECELSGQISDGYWENATPRDHWKQPANAKAIVGENVGIDFWAMRRYNFASADLLEVVRTRMILIARLAQRGYDYETIRNLECVFHCVEMADGRVDAVVSPELIAAPEWMDRYPEMAKRVAEVLTNDAEMNYIRNIVCLPIKTRVPGVYNLTMLNKELEDLNQIFRTRKV